VGVQQWTILKYHYPHCLFTYLVKRGMASLLRLSLSLSKGREASGQYGAIFIGLNLAVLPAGDPRQRHGQMGSLAGAAHLLNNNAGVPRATH
jgi:hypothetical protein